MSYNEELRSNPDDAALRSCAIAALRGTPTVPVATYRVQVFKDFPFHRIEQLAEYFHLLGISDLYLSPVTEARAGSNHGYDVVDHNCLNSEAGGEAAFRSMAEKVRSLGMGLLLDIVPNHMGIGPKSKWWQDVLQNGQASRYSEFFDIDWHPLRADMQGRLLLPVLGNTYGDELESGNLRLCFHDGSFAICYFDRRLPIDPQTLAPVLAVYAREIAGDAAGLLAALSQVPRHDTPDAKKRELRREQLDILLPQLSELLSLPSSKPVIDRLIHDFAGMPGDAASFDALHALLEAQPYRLAHWRTSGDDINYRRFFDVNDLVGLRMENPEVFAETHRLVRRLLAEGLVRGLRIDHCDGLFDPRQYLIRLQKLAAAAHCAGPEPAPGSEISLNGIEQPVREALRMLPWGPGTTAVYTLVEKILEPRETLPESWPVHGTSGYDFIFSVNNLFIQQKSERAFTDLYRRFAPYVDPPDETIYEKKLLIMNTALSSEVSVLTNLLTQLAQPDRHARDYTTKVLATVIRATIASFPVYRTYIDDRGRYTDQDKAYIRYAISAAKRRNTGVAAGAFDFLRDTLLLNDRESDFGGELFRKQLYFALKFQQLSGPVMAKGVEDTTFYVYNRFVSANEVGGSIRVFGISLEDFHRSNQDRAEREPYTMNASSTHDTKRSEDFRARLNVLSEMPREWRSACVRWERMNRRLKVTPEDGRTAPDGNEEYFLYQTIAGTLPWHLDNEDELRSYRDRLNAYMRKSLSEAKMNLSWVNPDDNYVDAVNEFTARLFDPKHRFLSDLKRLMPAIELFGAANALSQQLLKLTSPGVPDIYQGCEMWDFSMVDPDNRRPVDYECRLAELRRLRAAEQQGDYSELCADLLANFKNGGVKMWLTHRALQCRRNNAELFREGSYMPLVVDNGGREHAVAFMRERDGQRVVTIAPRFSYTLLRGKLSFPCGDVWGGSRLSLPAGRWRCMLSGVTLESNADGLLLRDAMRHFPGALLVACE